jgi:hypothetical protein
MKNLKYFLVLSTVTFIFINSCKKEEITDHLDTIVALEADYTPIISGNGIYDEDTVATPTILGSVRVNPYTVEVMKQAWNNLNPESQITSLLPTHLYVKFSPESESDYKLLAETDEMYYDYPLENELVSG